MIQCIFFFNRNERTAELTENSLNFFQNLFVEGPTLTVDHALTLDHATVDLSIPLGGEVVQFQFCAAR